MPRIDANASKVVAGDSEFCVQATSVAAQDCFALFYSPLEHVGRLFCRDDWIVGDWICCNEEQKNYLRKLREVPFSHMFVSSLSNLKADQTSAVEFSFQSVNGAILFCFAFTRLSVPKAVLQIIEVIYPTLRHKGLQFVVQDYVSTLEPNEDATGDSTTFFYPIAGCKWSRGGVYTVDKANPLLEMIWRGESRYNHQIKVRITSHRLTFRANSAWVKERADDQRIRQERVWLALAMGWHKRLGERSQIANINADVLRPIVILAFQNL